MFRRFFAMAFVLAWLGAEGNAHEIFFDDFSDGSVTNDVPMASDGTPVKWTSPDNQPGHYAASSGDYIFTATDQSVEFMAANALDFTSGDTSVRSQVRVAGIEGAAILTLRNQDVDDTQHYFGGVGYYPQYGGTVLFMGRNDPGDSRFFFPEAEALPVDLDVLDDDVVIQLDVIGNQVRLWAWQADEPMPTTPQLTGVDDTYASGFVQVASTSHNNNTAIFRNVRVADAHIVPEPNSVTLFILSVLGFLSMGRSHLNSSVRKPRPCWCFRESTNDIE
jgi:hypothetical protein